MFDSQPSRPLARPNYLYLFTQAKSVGEKIV
jgi:hypothetical protein